MPSHMGVQTFATERNSQVEFFVHYILDKFFTQLCSDGYIVDFTISSQKHYISEIASDVWDHYVSTNQLSTGRPLQLWCQTTCYKGNGTGKPEPNKTYEVRETLVEGISIRQLSHLDSGTDIRTVHFTVGDSNYTYQWFLGMKAASFDKSIYIGKRGYDIFGILNNLLAGAFTEDDKYIALDNSVDLSEDVGIFIKYALGELTNWFVTDKMKKSSIADLQWQLVNDELASNSANWPNISLLNGTDIKGRANRLLFEENYVEPDQLIHKTTALLLAKKPFLSSAIEAVANWTSICDQLQLLADQSFDLNNFILSLWNVKPPLHLITRRILLRIHTDNSIAYVQDLDIGGISEHNLYAGEHSDSQSENICFQILTNLSRANINTVDELMDAFTKKGKAIINRARWFEAKNGTQLKPSFEYVELALQSAGFDVVSPKTVSFRAVGYHNEIVSDNVNPYTNLKVVCDKNHNIIAIIKAKFFRVQEFPRRCKEEAFVGLSLKYSFNNGQFVPRLKVPLIMFIDMAGDCDPPLHALKRLICFGWNIVFSIDDLISQLNDQVESYASCSK